MLFEEVEGALNHPVVDIADGGNGAVAAAQEEVDMGLPAEPAADDAYAQEVPFFFGSGRIGGCGEWESGEPGSGEGGLLEEVAAVEFVAHGNVGWFVGKVGIFWCCGGRFWVFGVFPASLVALAGGGCFGFVVLWCFGSFFA
jgi:hypothetical protein